MIGGVTHTHPGGYVFTQGAFNTVLERHGGRGAALAAATEADDREAVLHAFQFDGAAVAGDPGVDDCIQNVLDLLGNGIIPAGAGVKYPEAALHQALDEIDGGTVKIVGADRVSEDLEFSGVTDAVCSLQVLGANEPQFLLSPRARKAERSNSLTLLGFEEVKDALLGGVSEVQVHVGDSIAPRTPGSEHLHDVVVSGLLQAGRVGDVNATRTGQGTFVAQLTQDAGDGDARRAGQVRQVLMSE